MVQNMKDYFFRIYELLSDIGVTDQKGTTLSMEEGTQEAMVLIQSIKYPSARKMMLIGNGGSAAIVSHMQDDFCKGAGIRAMVFNEPPLLMAFANDCGYEYIFERPINIWADNDNLLFAVSSSGESENVLRGVQASIRHQCRVITFSGFNNNNKLRRMGHLNFYVPSRSYAYVELIHSILGHFFTDYAESLNK